MAGMFFFMFCVVFFCLLGLPFYVFEMNPVMFPSRRSPPSSH